MTSSYSQVAAHQQQRAIIQEAHEAQKISHLPFHQSPRKDLDLDCAVHPLPLICKDHSLPLLRSLQTAQMASTNRSGSTNSLGYLELA